MKNIHIQLLLFTLIISVWSCDDRLDLAPTDILIEREVFSTAENAEAALSDVYHKLFLASTGNTHVIADASLPYVGLISNSFYSNYFNGNLVSTDSEVENIWTKYYETINVANVFIDKVPVFGTYDETLELQHIAEAKFNRAYSYLMLLCYFGHGGLTANFEGLCVPLQLKPYDGYNPSDLIPRNTNSEVYTQIETDLKEAIVDLPETYADRNKTRVRATKATARALLSRVLLYKRDYETCVEVATIVENNQEYSLEKELRELFPNNPDGIVSNFNDEVIFGFPVSSNGGNFQFGAHNIPYYIKNIYVSSDFIEAMDPNDKRRLELIYEGNPNNTNPATIYEQTTFKYNNSDQRDDVQIIRFAEVLLNKAEALTQLYGVNMEAIELLNQIRERSNLNLFVEADFPTKESLLTALYFERYVESAFEGRARFDFIRTERPLRNINLTEDEKIFPIPQREIDLSDNVLIQNPGYN
ncbi:RagB/SusD family nutrient uptake outer membrane protein [Cellulophaga omnivescoria]|uniref:RagB/SusD family nutrient uptake outer membrane protein n=1 Tax=Cellulophaga omnivescoria TaxID=1888890 RepID=UPI0009868533|nr:RagB/SusD family nutrient uptake outer membrane protein [Cellulophaga omnivescoria]